MPVWSARAWDGGSIPSLPTKFMKLKPRKVVWKMCRCKKAFAVVDGRCGHCFSAMMDKVQKRTQKSRLQLD